MRSFQIKRHLLISATVAGMAMLTSAPLHASEEEASKAYYFPEEANCTVMVDLADKKDMLDDLSEAERKLSIAELLVSEYDANGKEGCEDATSVKLLAVYISSVDSYGRPNFGDRINLIRLDGDAAALRDVDFSKIEDISDLGSDIEVVEYE
jgi:hypothetical protein